eukprot:6179552-Pyramimonas_sp.AAC.1
MTGIWAETERAETVTWNGTKENGIELKQWTRTVAEQNETTLKTKISKKKRNQERITSYTTKRHKVLNIKKDRKRKKYNINDCPGGKRSAGKMAQASGKRKAAAPADRGTQDAMDTHLSVEEVGKKLMEGTLLD